MTRERLEKVNQVLARRQPDLTVLLDGVHKPHNVAAILRSCDASGVLDAHMVKPKCGFGRHHATSGGAQKWMGGHYYPDVITAIKALKSKGFIIYAAHLSGRARDYRQFDYTKPTAFMLGAELFGVTREALDLVDGEVIIPMMGMAESLNVSVACALLLAEAQRQRMAAGHYDQCKLPAEMANRLRFEWLHPVVAEHFQKQGLPYPELDEEGDVIYAR